MKRFLARTAGWVAPTLVVVATLIAFSPALSNEFVDWDDPHNFTNNPAYQGLGWSQLTWMATTFHLGVYQPLAWAAAGLEYTIGGLDPAVYHVGSWLLHAATAAMVYAIAVLLLAPSAPSPTRLRVCAAAAALVFAVHPLRVEAVAWASAQGYPLAGMLFAGSIAAYLRAHRWPERASDPSGASAVHRAWFIVSLTLGLLAYLAKPISVTLPAMLVILDWFPLRRLGGNSGFGRASVWIEKLPYAIPAAVVAIVAPLARSALSGPDQYGLAAKVGRGFYGLAFYLWKTLAPVGLSHYYASPPHVNAFDPRFLVSAGIVLVVGTTIWLLRSRWPALA
ncbi:MAG: hypothetical protein HY207_04020, partial [Nitrospirae bacterium]|nr:hypothetical protein [Nitrospirota bacterium]